MPDPIRIDAERLAALIDGRLGEAEAAEVRAQLANADADTLAAYADAVALAGALRASEPHAGEASPPARPVRPIASAPSARRWLVPALGAIAAGVIGVAVLRTRDVGSPTTELAAGLPSGALDVPAWRSARSSDAPLTERGRAVRVGALLVQYELAARRVDTAAASRATMIASLLDGVPGGGAAAMRWRAVASERPAANTGARADDLEIARSLVDPVFVALGSWLESARAAAAGNQREWLDASSTESLARALASPALTAAERESITTVERLAKTRPIDIPALAAAVAAAEREMGR